MNGSVRLKGVDNVLTNLNKVKFGTIKQVTTQMEVTAGEMENSSKANRPWTDRTGDARRSIYGVVEYNLDAWIIYHGIGVDYGKYLELSNAGKYRIILPTVNKYRSIWLSRIKLAMGE